MKTSFEGLMNRWDTTEERIHELEDRPTEIIQREKGERKTEHLRFVPQYLEITGVECSQR